MFLVGSLAAGPVAEMMTRLGIRLEFLVPVVAILSMGAGIIVARFSHRGR
ncbi:MAG TPA: hypothetical protein VLB67_10200 [Acidimicrobiia bacterium]|nr:hypothetical protein [Acidimicrobiia bacterium]